MADNIARLRAVAAQLRAARGDGPEEAAPATAPAEREPTSPSETPTPPAPASTDDDGAFEDAGTGSYRPVEPEFEDQETRRVSLEEVEAEHHREVARRAAASRAGADSDPSAQADADPAAETRRDAAEAVATSQFERDDAPDDRQVQLDRLAAVSGDEATLAFEPEDEEDETSPPVVTDFDGLAPVTGASRSNDLEVPDHPADTKEIEHPDPVTDLDGLAPVTSAAGSRIDDLVLPDPAPADPSEDVDVDVDVDIDEGQSAVADTKPSAALAAMAAEAAAEVEAEAAEAKADAETDDDDDDEAAAGLLGAAATGMPPRPRPSRPALAPHSHHAAPVVSPESNNRIPFLLAILAGLGVVGVFAYLALGLDSGNPDVATPDAPPLSAGASGDVGPDASAGKGSDTSAVNPGSASPNPADDGGAPPDADGETESGSNDPTTANGDPAGAADDDGEGNDDADAGVDSSADSGPNAAADTGAEGAEPSGTADAGQGIDSGDAAPAGPTFPAPLLAAVSAGELTVVGEVIALPPAAVKRTWAQARRHCNNLRIRDVTGWDLPTVSEYGAITESGMLTRKGRYWTNRRAQDEDRNYTLAITVTTTLLRTYTEQEKRVWSICVWREKAE